MNGIKAALGRLYFACIRLLDKFFSIFGYKIFQVNYSNLLNGLDASEQAAAKDPSIVKPLNLYIEAYQKDDQLDAIARFTHLTTLKNTIKRRAGINRAIECNPDVTRVSEIYIDQ